jgi:hypothetical protein
MDLESLKSHISIATDYQINKRILREKIQTDLHFAHNGGLFKITPELLAFVQTWPNDELYLEDTYQNPIEIDKQVFLVMAQQHYQKVMNRWHQQHDELKKLRKIHFNV